jgi:hypothetical protein
MADRDSTDPHRRMQGWVAASLVLWVITYVLASVTLAAGPHGALVRGALAGIGIAAFVPWVIVSGKSILAQDDFSQRVHLIAIASAFAITGALSYAADLLQRAGFVPQIPVSTSWMLMVVLWWVAMVAMSWYYR